MPYNPNKHKRRSIRLKGYDYSQAGLYFITICVKDRECLFGKIEHDEMMLNKLGNIANNFWMEIPKHYPQVELHEHVVMPNHLHGIIEIMDAQTETNVGTRHGVSLHQHHNRKFSQPISGSISTIINQYKSSVKRWCNKNGHEYFQWQPRFHDHIIRSMDEYHNIANYIINNPAKWQEDKFYAGR